MASEVVEQLVAAGWLRVVPFDYGAAAGPPETRIAAEFFHLSQIAEVFQYADGTVYCLIKGGDDRMQWMQRREVLGVT